MDDATQSKLLQSILAPILQPGAQLKQTQTQTGEAAQQTTNLATQQPGEAATSTIDQINALKTAAPLNAAKDIQGGMTWDAARKKYTALGMNPDEVFNAYLSNSKYGPPIESPTTLIHQGVTQKSLGNVGDTGSYNDMYNTRNAIEGVRKAEDLFNKITPNDLLEQRLTGKNANINNYQIQRQNVGNHLASLIPGSSQAQATGQGNVAELPDATDARNFFGGIGKGAFQTIENGLLTTKNYKPGDIGLGPNNTQDNTNTGKELLNNVLGAVKNTENITHNPLGFLTTASIKSNLNDAIDTTNKVNQDIGNTKKTGNPLMDALSATGTMAKDTITPGRIGGDVASAVGARYLPPLLSRIFGGLGEAATEAVTPKGTPPSSSAPGRLSTILNPGKARAVLGTQRDSLVAQAEKGGSKVDGNSVVDDMNAWRETAKDANPGKTNAAKIDDIADGAVDRYHNQKLPPTKALSTYHEVDSGFTRSGATKETIQGSADQALRDSLEKNLDKASPGFSKLTRALGKNYQVEKGQPAKIIKNLPYNATKAGLNLAGFGVLRDILGG